jgi:hypothetical protein
MPRRITRPFIVLIIQDLSIVGELTFLDTTWKSISLVGHFLQVSGEGVATTHTVSTLPS